MKDLQLALCRIVIESLGQRVQRITKCSSRMAGRVDGCSNPNTTANAFADKYEDLLSNRLRYDTIRDTILTCARKPT